MTHKERIEKAKHVREEHKRACLLCATFFVILGGFLGVALGMHGVGFVVEAIGLILVAMV